MDLGLRGGYPTLERFNIKRRTRECLLEIILRRQTLEILQRSFLIAGTFTSRIMQRRHLDHKRLASRICNERYLDRKTLGSHTHCCYEMLLGVAYVLSDLDI